MKNRFFRLRLIALTASLTVFLPLSSLAETINITPEVRSVEISFQGKEYKIERTQEANKYLTNEYALTSRPSPPFYIQPFKVSKNVDTYGELEVLDFLDKKEGVFIDARLVNWYEKSYIPGAVNIPFKIFLSDSPERDKILKDFGGNKSDGSNWNFEKVKDLLFYCNGAWCGQSPAAIEALMKAGYPEKKMKYYRGGMQSWQLLGLSIIVPEKEVAQ